MFFRMCDEASPLQNLEITELVIRVSTVSLFFLQSLQNRIIRLQLSQVFGMYQK